MKTIWTKSLVIAFLFGCLPGWSQTYSSDNPEYGKLVEKAFDAMQAGDCQTCLDSYLAAFEISEKSALSMTRAVACAYRCKNAEMVKTLLPKAIHIDWSIVEGQFLRNDEFEQDRQSDLAEMIKKQCDAQKEALGLNLELMEKLSYIREEDQKYRRALNDELPEEARQEIIQKMVETDEKMLQEIIAILEEYGYPGRSLVGNDQSMTAWLVIQHADLETQEKYLPMMETAAENGEMSKSNLALLVDRIRMGKGEKQLYGSQIRREGPDKPYYVHPVEDPDAINERREKMNLGPIEDYISRWGLNWEEEKAKMEEKN